MSASEPPPNAGGADASTKRASQIITSRRKHFCCSIADRRRHYNGRRIVPLYWYSWECNSTKTGSRNNHWNTAYNIPLDNNQYRTQLRTVLLRIPLKKLQQGLRKESIATLECHASILLSFSSDVSLSSILISLFSRSRVRGPAWPAGFFSKASLYDSVCTAQPVAPSGSLLLSHRSILRRARRSIPSAT